MEHDLHQHLTYLMGRLESHFRRYRFRIGASLVSDQSGCWVLVVQYTNNRLFERMGSKDSVEEVFVVSGDMLPSAIADKIIARLMLLGVE